jgi:DNA polymerase-3 subunit delta'
MSSKLDEKDFGSWGPRHQPFLHGHDAAERTLLSAWRSGRLPHAWLLSGPKGIGKATLAFRFARFLLAGPGTDMFGAAPQNLFVAPEEAAFARTSSLGHADLMVLELEPDKKGERFRSEITVDAVRRLGPFFGQTAAEGGWRIAIVDSVDDLNRSGQNALLKTLEEPPAKGLILLVSHTPASLLPTVRSRCRRLTLRPPEGGALETVLGEILPEAEAGERDLLVDLAEGSPGRAADLYRNVGPDIIGAVGALLAKLPALEVQAWHGFADALARNKSPTAFPAVSELISTWCSRRARQAALDARPASVEAWLAARERAVRLFERAEAVYLDKKQVLLTVAATLQGPARAG